MHFREEYSFLSNFYPAPIVIQGIRYPTSEHAYQAAKTKNIDLRRGIAGLDTPGKAKSQGRMMKIRDDWTSIRLAAMLYIVRQKFIQHPELQDRLLATGNTELVEDNAWNDRFWGKCDGQGENHLGQILMKIRAEIQERRSKGIDRSN